MRTNASPFRLLRTAAIATAVLGLAATAHMAGGGVLPAPMIMTALAAFTVLASTLATQFRLSAAPMVAILLSSQLVLHEAFGRLSTPTFITPGGNPATAAALNAATALANSGHLHSSLADTQAMALMNSAAAQGSMGMGTGTTCTMWMTVAHIAAALATAVVLAKGESALWTLADWLRPLVSAPIAPAAIPAPRHGVLTTQAPRQGHPWRSLRLERLRGPPSTAVFFA